MDCYCIGLYYNVVIFIDPDLHKYMPVAVTKADVSLYHSAVEFSNLIGVHLFATTAVNILMLILYIKLD